MGCHHRKRSFAASRTRARALPWPEFRAKLLGYLLRRGFSYETASRTVRDLWEAQTNERPDAAEDEGLDEEAPL